MEMLSTIYHQQEKYEKLKKVSMIPLAGFLVIILLEIFADMVFDFWMIKIPLIASAGIMFQISVNRLNHWGQKYLRWSQANGTQN